MSSGGALVANTASSSNTTPPGKAGPGRAGPAPRRRLVPAPDQEWMTQALIDDVVASMLDHARVTRRPYGEGRLVEEHAANHSPLPDGSELTKHKAREVKSYITRYRLLEAAS